MSKPPVEVPQGAIRFNTDSHRLEFYAQDQWWEMSADTPYLGGNGNASTDPTGNSVDQTLGTRGCIFSGSSIPGSSGATNIDYINISSKGNAVSFGSLSYGNAYRGGCSSSTRGIVWNGQNDQTVDYFTFSSTGSGASFAEAPNDNMGGATFSNEVKGFRAGGSDAGTHTNQILAMTIATNVNTFFDFGDMTPTGAGTYMNGCASPTRGMIFGGATPSTPSAIDNIQYVNMGSNGNSHDFGDLIRARKYATCFSNSTRAITATGSDGSGTNRSEMEYVTMSTKGNATDFGDAIYNSSTGMSGSCSSSTRGILAGAYSISAHIEYVTIPTEGNGLDFGDLTYHGYYCGGASNGHGGL